ncbi:MAG: flagellar hook-length control protein FliK [Succinivibrio sp.]
MQAVGNTSTKQETKLATNGRYSDYGSGAADFSSVLSSVASSFSQSDALHSICTRMSESMHTKLNSRQSESNAVKTDSTNSRKAFLDSKRNLDEKSSSIEQECGSRVTEDERRAQGRKNEEDPSTELEQVVFDENTCTDAELVSPSTDVCYACTDRTVTEDSFKNSSSLQLLSQKDIKTEENFSLDDENAIQADGLLSEDNLSSIKTLQSALTDNDLSSADSKMSPSDLDKILTGRESLKDLISSVKTNQTDTNNAGSSVLNQTAVTAGKADTDSTVGDWMKSLLDEANVESVTIEKSSSSSFEESDFGAEDFELIEQSLKASTLMDEKLRQSDTKAKIDSIMDSKEEALASNLEKSLELLRSFSVRNASQNGVSENNLQGVPSARQVLSDGVRGISSLQEGSQSMSSEQSLMSIKAGINSVSAAGESSNSGGSNAQTGEHQSGFGMLMGAQNKQEVAGSYSKTEQLMNMSGNLKANAQALTEKVMQMAAKNQKVMHLNLNPEGMGKMKISIDCTGADEITRISVSVSSAATRAVLDQGMDALRQSLRDNNITAQAEITEYDDFASGQNDSSSEWDHGQGDSGREGFTGQNSENGTLFASDDNEALVSENSDDNDGEYLVNSQNGDTISYFA